MKILFYSLIVSIFFLNSLSAQDNEAQFPVVKNFGGVFNIENSVEKLQNEHMKIIVELVSGPEDWKEPSFWVNNVARLMNLHGLAGITSENLEVIVIVHGPAVLTLLNDEQYKKEFKRNNPNIPLYDALTGAGAKIVVCGQSLLFRDIDKEHLYKNTEIALSALTTISGRVQEGFVQFKF